MKIMKKPIPDNYTYNNFLSDFGIDLEVFNRFNSTSGSHRKESYKIISKGSNKYTYKQEKTKNGFKAVCYLNNVNGKEKLAKMDFLYRDICLFESVNAQVFIFTTGIILNSRFHKNYDYNSINEFYKFFTERYDRGPWRGVFDCITSDLVKLNSVL